MGRSQEAYEKRLNGCVDPEDARRLIKEGALLTLDTPERRLRAWRFLESACRSGKRDLALFFIRHGADINCPEARGRDARSPLASMVAASHLEGHRQGAFLMIELGCDPNWAPEGKHTPLMAAILSDDPELTRALLVAGADPNAAEPGRCSPLMIAVSDGDSEETLAISSALLEFGADPEALDGDGLDALDHAQQAGSDACAEIVRAWIEREALGRATGKASKASRSDRSRL